MKTLQIGPRLQRPAKTGKTVYWEVHLLSDGAGVYLRSAWWQEGMDTPQMSTPERIRGKNAGRSNETSDRQQAQLEFERAIQRRRDKGFSEDGSAAHVYLKPMLAHKFDGRQGSIEYPVYAQPKLDGFRMLMDGDKAWTRGGKDHTAACVQHLMFNTGDLIVDGELLLPGNQPLQVTSSAAKKYQPGVSETLEYHVYDIVEPEMPFSERTGHLAELLAGGAPKNVRRVPTLLAKDEAEVMQAHALFVGDGYEGTIIRAASGLYEVGFRSHGLLKLKDFQDAEFQVADVEHGKGSFEDKAILVFFTHDGSGYFNAVPEGDSGYRRMLWMNRKRIVGTWWTVRYQTLSKDGKPIFPVAVAQRGAEDR